MKLLLALLCIFPHYGYCQVEPANPVRIHILGTGALAIGSFKNGDSNNPIFSYATSAGGGGVSLTIPFHDRFHIGFGARIINAVFDYNIVRKELSGRYVNSQYSLGKWYANSLNNIYMHYLGPEISWLCRFRGIEIEPSIRFGIAMHMIPEKGRIRYVRTNIATGEIDMLNISHANGGIPVAPFGCAGLRLNKLLARNMVALTFGAVYSATYIKTSFKEEIIDFNNNRSEVGMLGVRNNISTFQFDFGIQFRLWQKTKAEE